MRFVQFLRKAVGLIGGVAVPAIIQSINPAMAPVVQAVLSAVLSAEGRHGAGQGAAKKDWVLEVLQTSSPLIIQTIERATGKELADDEAFAAGMSQVVDGFVAILNAFRIMPKPVAAGGTK